LSKLADAQWGSPKATRFPDFSYSAVPRPNICTAPEISRFVARMLGLRILLTSAFAGAVASAGSLPDVSDNAAFRYNARRQVANGTSKSFHGPYSTQGRDIVDSRGEKITWAGVNWPMSGETMSKYICASSMRDRL
jgi:hypothetical protein